MSERSVRIELDQVDNDAQGGASGSSPTPLRIEAIETELIRVPLDRVYQGSHYRMTHRSTTVTRVYTTHGVVGEAYAGDEDSGLAEIDKIIHEEVAPRIIGQDAMATERCWAATRPVTFDILRDRRLGLVATACVDAAIWDAVGKALGQPLWRLWGGVTDTLPVIAIGGYYSEKADIGRDLEEIRGLGVAGMKFKVGGLSPAEDAQRFREARAAAGPDFILLADVNQGWQPREAIEFAKLVEDADLYWLEEPCRWDNDIRAMRDVRMVSGVRICAGQSELSAAGCRNLMVEGAIDVCNFDSSWSGGPTEWRRVAAMASLFDVAMGHHEEPQAASHLLGSTTGGTFVECFHPDRDPIWWNLIANRPKLVGGKLTLTANPGWGWELDAGYVNRYQVGRRRSSA